MVLIMDDPDPSFTAQLEPAELLRRRCARCHEAVAALECAACEQAFCAACENLVHGAQRRLQHVRDPVKRERSFKEREDEESKGEQRAHQTHVVAINMCQVCAQKSVAFLCVDCQSYQCEACCATRHLHVESFSTHLYFCVEGSSSSLIRYARWSPEFLEMAKMSRRMKVQELEDERAAAATALAAKLEAAIGVPAVTSAAAPAPSATTTAASAVQPRVPPADALQIKLERAQAAAAVGSAHPAEPIQDMQALSLSEQQSEDASMANQNPAATPAAASQTLTPSPFVKREPTTPSPFVAPTLASTAATAQPPTPQTEPASASVKLEQQPSAAPTTRSQPSQPALASFVVDLTEDDDELEEASIRNVKREPFSSTSIFGSLHSVPAATSRPSGEPAIKKESSAWLAAAASAGSTSEAASGDTAHDEDESDDGLFLLTDGDPVMNTMVSEYNRLSEVIFNHEQQIAAIQNQIKEMLANQAADMNEVVKCSSTAAQVKNSVVKETHNRNAVVARLVLYLKRDPAELKALLDESQAIDIPHAQSTSHRRCAQLEALIREKRRAIRKLKRSMEEAMNMKSTNAFAEVSRLGAMVVADEQAVKESEEDRLVEFIRLFQFSNQIRNAVRNMVNNTSAP